MKIQTGNRKFIGFLILVIAFLIICLAVLALAVILKGDKFSIPEYAGIFFPLASGLTMIGGAFFFTNSVVNSVDSIANRSKNKAENKAENKGEASDGNS